MSDPWLSGRLNSTTFEADIPGLIRALNMRLKPPRVFPLGNERA